MDSEPPPPPEKNRNGLGFSIIPHHTRPHRSCPAMMSSGYATALAPRWTGGQGDGGTGGQGDRGTGTGGNVLPGRQTGRQSWAFPSRHNRWYSVGKESVPNVGSRPADLHLISSGVACGGGSLVDAVQRSSVWLPGGQGAAASSRGKIDNAVRIAYLVLGVYLSPSVWFLNLD